MTSPEGWGAFIVLMLLVWSTDIIDWISDKKVQDVCSKRRPDVFADFGSHILIVEIDENQHNDMMTKGQWRLSHKATQAALLILLYRDQPILHNPYQLLTKLADVDELFTTWRYRHALMVSRMIGTKIGTGGSTGSTYLNQTAEKHRIFSDISALTTFLIPRSSLPDLPAEVRNDLGFYFHVKDGK